jgi:tetratricopeptide (TPR) repeat protein
VPEEAPPVEEPEEVEVPAPAAEVPEKIALVEEPEAPAPEPVPVALEEEVALIEEEEPVPEPEPAWEGIEEALAPEEAPPVEAIEEALVEDLEGFIAARQAYAEAHPEDHEAWLDLGRVLWQADQRAEAIETYNHLIASSELLDDVVPDLEDYVAQWPDASLQQALGDAYMRADRLTDALDIYRRALAGL